MEAIGAALLFASAAAIAFLHLRHIPLVALVLLSPLPGLALVLALMGTLDGLTAASLAWFVAFAFNLLLADEAILRIAAGAVPRVAVREAFAARWRPLLAAVLAVSVADVFVIEPSWQGLVAFLPLAAAGTGAPAMLLAGHLAYGEDFIARSNRTRERWQPVFDRLIAVARPRWGFSVAGIALVFAVLAAFGAQPLHLAPGLASRVTWAVAGGGVIFALAGGFAIGDWRATLSTLAALALGGMVGVWGLARLGAPVTLATGTLLVLVLGFAAILLFTTGAEAGRYGRAGDDATIASARMLARMGPGLLAAGLAGVVGLLLSALVWHGVALAVMAGFAGAGPLLFQPALAIVLETWFPRAAAVAGRYRLH